MTLTFKETELVAVATSIAAGCKPCTNYHLREARKASAAEEEVQHAVATAASIRRGATDIMETHGLKHPGAASSIPDEPTDGVVSRSDGLVSIGAAFAVNCTSSLEKHLRFAEAAGITQDDVKAVAEIAAFVKRMAASHVEKLVGLTSGTDAQQEPHDAECGSCN